MIGVDITRKCNFGIITLKNPSIHNALKIIDIELIRSTLQSWNKCNLSAILITGSGKSFCSGLFINELENKTWTENPISLLCNDIENSKCPVIAALNGSVFGGALELVLACDFRVANKKISISVPAAKLGIHYEPSGIDRAINLLGLSVTRQLFLLGETLHADKLNRASFIDFWIDEPQTVLEKAKELITSIEQNAPLAVVGMKKVIVELINGSLDHEAAFERIQECFNSSDHQEALIARRENRSPVFKGF